MAKVHYYKNVSKIERLHTLIFLLVFTMILSGCGNDKSSDDGTQQLKEQQKQKIIEEMQSSEDQFDVLVKHYGKKDVYYALGYSLGKNGSYEAYRSLIQGLQLGQVMGTSSDGRFETGLTSGYEDGSSGKSTSEKTNEIIELIEISNE